MSDRPASDGPSRGVLPSPRKILVTVTVVMLVLGAFNLLMNPFGVWPVDVISHDAAKASRDRVFPAYAARVTMPVHTALVGTSRTRGGFWIESMVKDGVLNASLPASTLRETAAIVGELSKREDVQTILWEASFFNYGKPWELAGDPRSLRRVRGDLGLQVAETLFSGLALKSSYRLLLRRLVKSGDIDARPIPWPLETVQSTVQRERKAFRPEQFDVGFSLRGYCRRMADMEVDPERIDLVTRTVARATSRGKKVLLLVPPASEYLLEVYRQSGQWQTYQDWKRQLVQIAPVWDFSGYHRLSRERALYRDANHVGAAVGWVILRVIQGEDLADAGDPFDFIAAAGRRLTPDTVEAHLAAQDRMMEQRLPDNGAIQEEVAALIERHRGPYLDRRGLR